MQALEGRIAFITGGASGIGFGMARAFLRHGMKVIVADIRQEHLDMVAAALDRSNGDYHLIRLDVTDRAAMERAADEAERVFGKVHVLCNNAGVASTVPMDEASFADWDFVMNINLGGVINGTTSFLPRIKAHREGGHVVNTSSIGGILPLPGPGGIYTASKFAVRGLTESLRMALAPHGIGVSLLCPGLVRTNLAETTEHLDPSGKRRELSPFKDIESPLDFGMDPLDIGERVVAGIIHNEAYILPHGEFKDEVREAFAEIVEAFPADQAVDPKRAAVEAGRRQATIEAKKAAAGIR
ncbi:SDR family oxidoreductase [Bradyrhizobium sp. CB1015]|uniref:SDR family oxidoreductase n=1 Tax=Bradyrhizobium sp. CB1015 TaxID=2976822 RepID=UPI0021AAEAE0|nr:SDR family NAD(P)-dependent oxidoreductase [Bradyrhizobium sp. CB1015]UWU95760.1 SDR family NAD(P)-dependent oxidoreductase [Bradyrhizobium sp. CB1015]